MQHSLFLLSLFHPALQLPKRTCIISFNKFRDTNTSKLTCCSRFPTLCTHAHMHTVIFISVYSSLPIVPSCVSKMGISVMSSAAGDNKLVEEPITSRWQAGGSGLSTCHYLHINISKSPDRAISEAGIGGGGTLINPGKEKKREGN